MSDISNVEIRIWLFIVIEQNSSFIDHLQLNILHPTKNFVKDLLLNTPIIANNYYQIYIYTV